MMQQTQTPTISDIVRHDYRTADVFSSYGINYCCSGSITLATACENLGIDLQSVNNSLTLATSDIRVSGLIDFSNWKPAFLIDYIIHVHHAYLHRATPLLVSQLDKFIAGHSRKIPWLPELGVIFERLSADLISQSRRQENETFPYIRHLEDAVDADGNYGRLFIKTLRKPLSGITSGTAPAEKVFDCMRKLTSGYSFASNACTTHQVVFHRLEEFEREFRTHSNLENAILLPRALKMEEQLLHP